MIQKLFLILALTTGTAFSLFSQNLEEQEQKLVGLFEKLQFAPDDNTRNSVNAKIKKNVKHFIQSEKSFDYEFDKLKRIGAVRSDDNKLRAYTWNYINDAGEFHYFGFLQFYARKKRDYLIFELQDRSAEMQNPQVRPFNTDEWYGALYYKIVSEKHRRIRSYALLGWDGNDKFTNKKIVETVQFNKHGEIISDKPVIKQQNTLRHRLIFEYGEKVSMLLHYDKRHKMIVWDHLAPSKPELKGQYMFYGPDSSYDGLYFNKGVWDFYSDINITNEDGQNPEPGSGKSDTLIPDK